jgi:hypothetical protein
VQLGICPEKTPHKLPVSCLRSTQGGWYDTAIDGAHTPDSGSTPDHLLLSICQIYRGLRVSANVVSLGELWESIVKKIRQNSIDVVG